MLDYFPNADHAGIYAAQAAATSRGRARRRDPDAAGPGRAAEAAAPRARPTCDLLRARAAARARPGRELVAVGALVQKPLTSIMSLRPRASKTPAGPRGQARRDGGIPYQSAYLKTILERRGSTRARSRRSTSASTSCRRCWPRRSTRRSARSGTTRASSSSGASASRRSSAWRTLGVPTYNELVLVARRKGWTTAGGRGCGASCTRSAAGHRRCATNPAAGSTRCWRPTRTSTATLRRRRQGDAAGLLPGDTGSRGAGMEPDEWAPTALDVREQADHAAAPGRRR